MPVLPSVEGLDPLLTRVNYTHAIRSLPTRQEDPQIAQLELREALSDTKAIPS
jgi:hypothetical protein